jgi:hypothetical protein
MKGKFSALALLLWVAVDKLGWRSDVRVSLWEMAWFIPSQRLRITVMNKELIVGKNQFCPDAMHSLILIIFSLTY